MTYTNVHLLLEGDAAHARALLRRWWSASRLMRELAEILMRKRYKRGSIDFDLPEPLIEFDEIGEMTGVTRSPRNIAHRIIEEFMLAANEAVAAHLEADRAIRRFTGSTSQPDPKRVMEFEEIAAQFGYSLGVGAIPVSAASLSREEGARAARRIRTSCCPARSRSPRRLISSWWRRSRASRKSAF